MIMLSETYQLASAENAANQEIDADNDFLWRFNRQRLDAESLRDSLLAISGELEPGPGGPHPFPNMGTWMFMQHDPFNAVYPSQAPQRLPDDAAHSAASVPSDVRRRRRRHQHRRTSAHHHANPGAVLHEQRTGSRHRAALGEASDGYTYPKEQRRVETAFRTALGRPATADELARAGQYLAEARKTSATVPRRPGPGALASYLRALLCEQ